MALSISRTNAEYKETLGIILDEAEKLDKKINALLMIAQTGFDGKIQKWIKYGWISCSGMLSKLYGELM